jgi:hypothetical protein
LRRNYLFEDGLEVINHRVGRVSLGLAGGSVDGLELAEAAPLVLLFEAAGLRVLVLAEDGGQGASVQDALEGGIEEASVSQVVQTAPDGQLAHVEANTKLIDNNRHSSTSPTPANHHQTNGAQTAQPRPPPTFPSLPLK